MMKRRVYLSLALFSAVATAIFFYGIEKWELQNLQSNIETTGIWAPLIYVIVYVLATAENRANDK
jgi:uncharacterized membrane protein YdjX (TVP38/TMEM64 family)